jgi:hypothetical protein
LLCVATFGLLLGAIALAQAEGLSGAPLPPFPPFGPAASSWWHRWTDQIARLGTRDVDAALVSGTWYERELALAVIARGESAGTHLAIEALSSPEPSVREAACVSIARLPSLAASVTPAITRLLEDPAEDVRVSAAWALAQRAEGAASAVPALLDRLWSDTRAVRLASARAIARISPRPPAAIERALSEQDTMRRSWALLVAFESGPHSAPLLPTLRSLLEARIPDADHARLILTLGRIGPDAREAAPILAAQLIDPHTTRAAELRQALVGIGPDAVPVLARIAGRPVPGAEAAANAIAAIGPDALATVSALLRGGDLEERLGAVSAVAKMLRQPDADAPALVGLLTEATQDSHEPIRKSACRSLGAMRSATSDVAAATLLESRCGAIPPKP